MTGFVLGMATIVVKPPWAAASAPVSTVSFIGKAGVTEMYMQIDESRHHITAGSIHDPAVFSGSIRLFLIRILFLYFPNFAVTDPQVIKTIALIYRIQKTAPLIKISIYTTSCHSKYDQIYSYRDIVVSHKYHLLFQRVCF